MKYGFLILGLLATAPLGSRAQDAGNLLSDSQLQTLDQRGYLTPAFKSAVRDLVNAKQTQRDAEAQQDRMKRSLSDLENQANEEENKVAALQKELSQYTHPNETDFVELQNKMKDASATPEEQLALAQAYVWTYPTGAHAPEAQQDLEQVQKKIADQVRVKNQTEAAHETAQVKLLERVKTRDLSLEEWRIFLQDKTRAEVSQYLGQPSETNGDEWTYSGAWTTDPTTHRKMGLHLNFNGGRVLSVSPTP